jgi:DNA-binding NarL/FixJ family response regulator
MGVTLLEKAFMMRILIADDHEMVRNATRRILESRGGIECVEARDGKEAVEQALELKPDLIVLHISMPSMLLRRLSGTCLMFRFFSIYDDGEYLEKARSLRDGIVITGTQELLRACHVET